jgi:hypothetical protein
MAATMCNARVFSIQHTNGLLPKTKERPELVENSRQKAIKEEQIRRRQARRSVRENTLRCVSSFPGLRCHEIVDGRMNDSAVKIGILMLANFLPVLRISSMLVAIIIRNIESIS